MMAESSTYNSEGYWEPPEFCECKVCDSCNRNGVLGLCIYQLRVGDNHICASCKDWHCTDNGPKR